MALRVGWRGTPNAERLAPMVALSLASHLAAVSLGVLVPRVIPRRPPPGAITIVDLVSLPPGEAGPLEAPRATPPPPAGRAEQPPPPEARKATPKARKPEAVKLPELKKSAQPKAEPRPTVPPEPKPAAGMTPPGATPQPGPAPGVGGTGEAGLGSNTGGGIGALDAETFEFAWYRAALTQRLRSVWVKPLVQNLASPTRATVYFKITRSGQIIDIQMESASDLEPLDRSALRAVYEANPLPPLPYAYKDDTLGVHFFFELRPE